MSQDKDHPLYEIQISKVLHRVCFSCKNRVCFYMTQVPAIQQKRTVAFLNQFVVHTVQFLNRFSAVCEEKLADLSLRIQQIETTLNILDAKVCISKYRVNFFVWTPSFSVILKMYLG
ncbi:rCG48808 [Rattus norvegicus]|uniref:WASH complex subunit 3 n=1 Tax=Rattus norvegicus TaxID=10116 RepID=A6IFN7_RAT|nr:rCG48808 [Rattus norvegicus]